MAKKTYLQELEEREEARAKEILDAAFEEEKRRASRTDGDLIRSAIALGITLERIAKKYGMTVGALAEVSDGTAELLDGSWQKTHLRTWVPVLEDIKKIGEMPMPLPQNVPLLVSARDMEIFDEMKKDPEWNGWLTVGSEEQVK